MHGFFVSFSSDKVPVADFAVFAFFDDFEFEFVPVRFEFLTEFFVAKNTLFYHFVAANLAHLYCGNIDVFPAVA